MKRPTRRFVLTLSAAAFGAGFTVLAQQPARPLGALVVPAGFKFEVFAENVTNARMMALGPQGTVFVGSMRAGKVHAVVDTRRRPQSRSRGHDRQWSPLNRTASRCATARSTSRPRAGSCGSTTSSATSTRPRRRSSCATACPMGRGLPLVEVHRVRTRRPALHVGRRALQRVRPSRDDGVHPADEARRVGRGGVRRGSAQQRRLRRGTR